MKFCRALIACGVLFLMACCGCDSQPATEPSAAPNAKSISVSAASQQKLAVADKADGNEDHVIERCYACSLGMKGQAEYAVEVDGYTAHFCSEECREHFQANAETVVASTTVPETKK